MRILSKLLLIASLALPAQLSYSFLAPTEANAGSNNSCRSGSRCGSVQDYSSRRNTHSHSYSHRNSYREDSSRVRRLKDKASQARRDANDARDNLDRVRRNNNCNERARREANRDNRYWNQGTNNSDTNIVIITPTVPVYSNTYGNTNNNNVQALVRPSRCRWIDVQPTQRVFPEGDVDTIYMECRNKYGAAVFGKASNHGVFAFYPR